MKNLFTITLCALMSLATAAQKKSKNKAKAIEDSIEVAKSMEIAPDTSKKFTGIIKYYITTDERSVKDSMFVIVGDEKIRIVMFYPGYKETDIFQDNMIADFHDSTFIVLDNRKKVYKTEKLGARNGGTELLLSNTKKTGMILQQPCPEFSGEMVMKDGETFEAAALLSKQHYYITVADYNFLNIQPVVHDYKLVLGYRTRSSTNENTYIMAYKVEAGNTDTWFDLSGYKSSGFTSR